MANCNVVIVNRSACASSARFYVFQGIALAFRILSSDPMRKGQDSFEPEVDLLIPCQSVYCNSICVVSLSTIGMFWCANERGALNRNTST